MANVGSRARIALPEVLKLRKMVEDYEGSISLLYDVVALEPESCEYETMLAQALASHPVMKIKAVRHFRRALFLESAECRGLLSSRALLPVVRHEVARPRRVQGGARTNPKLSRARGAVVSSRGRKADSRTS
jgi:hypothetical protein